MNRKTRQFLEFAERLDEELDKNIELFFKQRPFLDRPENGYELEIRGLTDEDIEEKVQNEYTIETIIEKIKDLADL